MIIKPGRLLSLFCVLWCFTAAGKADAIEAQRVSSTYPALDVAVLYSEEGNIQITVTYEKQPVPFSVSRDQSGIRIYFPGFSTSAPSIIPIKDAVFTAQVQELDGGTSIILPGTGFQIGQILQLQNKLVVTLSTSGLRDGSSASIVGNTPASLDPLHTYQVGPGDVLTTSVFRHEDLSKSLTVQPDGTINFPLLGTVAVRGMTPAEIAEHLADMLGQDYVVNPQVLVGVAEYKSQFVNVIGEVKNPGKYFLRGPTSLIDILAEAGGLTTNSGSVIVVTRYHGTSNDGRRSSQIQITKQDLFAANNDKANVSLISGDVVRVPETEFFYIRGEVNQPGQYPLRARTTIQKAISLAGGFSRWADVKDLQLIRDVEGESKRLKLNMRKIAKGDAPDLKLKPEDIIVVPRRLL